jgi:glycosyltransferase involved in cell wall biosynthesis
MLLHFLRWLKANSTRPFSVLLYHPGGELAPDFADVASTWCAADSHWCPGGLRSQLMTAVGLESLARRAERADLRRFATSCRPGLIYLAGFASTNFRLIELLGLKVPMLTHVHEQGYLFRVQGASATPRILSATRHFVACSDAVKRYLTGEHKVAPERIDTVHEFIPVAQTRSGRSREDVFQELSLPPDATLVVASGTADWRKGMDLFIHLARIVCRQRPYAYFVWIGGGAIDKLQHDAHFAGLSAKMRFTGEVSKPSDYFAAADILALTSREDPFPLVCLEAAALGKPIVCFADAGGMPEFVEGDCGFVVPYLDVPAMANSIICLLDCAPTREKMGAAARRKVAERHDVSVAAPRILEIIERTIAGD